MESAMKRTVLADARGTLRGTRELTLPPYSSASPGAAPSPGPAATAPSPTATPRSPTSRSPRVRTSLGR